MNKRSRNNAIWLAVIGVFLLAVSLQMPTFEVSGITLTPEDAWDYGFTPSWLIAGVAFLLGAVGILMSKPWGRWIAIVAPILLIVPAIIIVIFVPVLSLGYEVILSSFLLAYWVYDIHKKHFRIVVSVN